MLRKTSLVPAPTPLSQLRDFHSIDSSQKDSVAFPSGSCADYSVCAPNKRPERQWPLHHSQREIASGEDWTDFEYWLRISNDFYTPMLSRGPNIKVLQPQWLAEEIRQQLLKAAGLYE